jgi:hypothetical protein
MSRGRNAFTRQKAEGVKGMILLQRTLEKYGLTKQYFALKILVKKCYGV